MFKRQDVEFEGEGGVTLRGWLFASDAPGRYPAISMCHGFAAVKEHGLEPFARTFARSGFVVLVHDHRNFGASDGTPRQDIDPRAQISDWRRALDYLVDCPEVDASRIGIWGSSYSGAGPFRHRLTREMRGVAGADDQRLGTKSTQGAR